MVTIDGYSDYIAIGIFFTRTIEFWWIMRIYKSRIDRGDIKDSLLLEHLGLNGSISLFFIWNLNSRTSLYPSLPSSLSSQDFLRIFMEKLFWKAYQNVMAKKLEKISCLNECSIYFKRCLRSQTFHFWPFFACFWAILDV